MTEAGNGEQFKFRDVVLQGKFARLEPLQPAHAEGLFAAGATPEIWRFFTLPPIAKLADAEGFIASALANARGGKEWPYAIIDLASGKVAGSTRYLDLRAEHFGVEIGSTWLGLPYQRTAINTECKLMLLGHAFEVLGMQRVQLKTGTLNVKSQRAIERLGAVREGVLRSHMLLPPSPLRDKYHEELGLIRPASKDEIDRAFRELALQLHPDKAKSPEELQANNERLAALEQAYKALKAPALRDTVMYSILRSEWPAVRDGLRAKLENR